MNKKIRAKNKFLLCFRPVPMDGPLKSGGKDNSGETVLAYISVPVKDDLMIPAIIPPLTKTQSLNNLSEKQTAGGRRRKKVRQIVSKIIKAMVVDNVLRKKVRNGKIRQNPNRSENGVCTKNEKQSEVTHEELVAKARQRLAENYRKSNPSISSTSTSSLSSSSLTSSSSFSSSRFPSTVNPCADLTKSHSKISRSFSIETKLARWNSFDQTQSNWCVEDQSNLQEESLPKKVEKSEPATGFNNKSYAGLYLLLISLLVMIFWGRLCSILCTSTWLYFIYCDRNSSDDRPVNMIKMPILMKLPADKDSSEYKKKVIMEGLLGRNHRV